MISTTTVASESGTVSIRHTGSFELRDTPEQALYLFTAPGEIIWVPGWEPVIMSGDGFEEGTVFLTHHDHEETIWVVVDFDTKACRARYARITPSSKAGTVEVNLSENESGGSTVEVTYELTALSEAGVRNLEHFDEKAYAEMLVEWKSLVESADIDYASLIPR